MLKDVKQNHISNSLDNLHNEILQCRLCQDIFGFEPRPIVLGNHRAKIMQIGQAPSKSVHETGKPFNDASGKRLRREWYQISDEDFYNPDYFYITSVAHCYPGKAPGGGDRRPPKICSKQWLLKEMELVENEIYILIGGFAAEIFFPGEKIASLAFVDKEINGKPAYILPHPSPLNMKWFKDYPQFTEERVLQIRKEIHRVLGIKEWGPK
ncbi:uracil-DNA glycosylase family protein [Alkaliphilus crotonatoxidans]